MTGLAVPRQQWLSPPDGNILATLTDPRISATAVGAAGGAFVEKQLWTAKRDLFGVASLENGVLKFYAVDSAGKTTNTEAPQLGTNRHLARLGIVVACVAGIEYIPNGLVQYVLLGVGAVALAHTLQDLVPAIR